MRKDLKDLNISITPNHLISRFNENLIIDFIKLNDTSFYLNGIDTSFIKNLYQVIKDEYPFLPKWVDVKKVGFSKTCIHKEVGFYYRNFHLIETNGYYQSLNLKYFKSQNLKLIDPIVITLALVYYTFRNKSFYLDTNTKLSFKFLLNAINPLDYHPHIYQQEIKKYKLCNDLIYFDNSHFIFKGSKNHFDILNNLTDISYYPCKYLYISELGLALYENDKPIIYMGEFSKKIKDKISFQFETHLRDYKIDQILGKSNNDLFRDR